jgi:Rrf2 family transcriptional regulator, cysteine metabolism repressor
MKLSIKTDYACRAVELMARQYNAEETMHVEELARVQGIPENYLIQILLVLKSSGLVKSKRGKEGGYCLARPPAEITFGDVVRSVQGAVIDIPSLNDPKCSDELKDVWRRIKVTAEKIADETTFEDVVNAAQSTRRMFYI